MRQLSLYTIVTFLVGVSLGGGLGYVLSSDTVIVRKETPDTPAALSSVNLMIVSDKEVKTWNTVSWNETMTPLSLLEKVSGVGEISFQKNVGKDGATQVFTINEVSNDDAGRRWRIFVNNVEPARAPDKYSLKPGDMVVWAFAP
jgi:hypothetical protein